MIGMLMSLLIALWADPAAAVEQTARISVSDTGEQANGHSIMVSMSGNGRFVVFESSADNLVPGDSNGYADIFLWDRESGSLARVSLSSSGVQANGPSYYPVISSDGQYIAFSSRASNLVESDTSFTDVFVVNRITGVLEKVSVSYVGAVANGSSNYPSLSADGRFVAFVSSAPDLVPDDTNVYPDIFVYDRQTGSMERVTLTGTAEPPDGEIQATFNRFATIDGTGRFIVFSHSATNLVPGDTNGLADVFVYDRETRQVELVSVSSTGEQANGASYAPSVSTGGRYVLFVSEATNLSPTWGNFHVYLRDRWTGSTEIASVGADGIPVAGYGPALSEDGRFIAYWSSASTIVEDDTNNAKDLFVQDRSTGQSVRANLTSTGGQGGNGGVDNSPSVLNQAGSAIAFSSFDSSLVPDDTNNMADVFVALVRWAESTPVPTVTYPYPEAQVPTSFTATGTSVPGALVQLTHTASSSTFETYAGTDGTWSLQVTLSEGWSTLFFTAEVNGIISAPANGSGGIPITAGTPTLPPIPGTEPGFPPSPIAYAAGAITIEPFPAAVGMPVQLGALLQNPTDTPAEIASIDFAVSNYGLGLQWQAVGSITDVVIPAHAMDFHQTISYVPTAEVFCVQVRLRFKDGRVQVLQRNLGPLQSLYVEDEPGTMEFLVGNPTNMTATVDLNIVPGAMRPGGWSAVLDQYKVTLASGAVQTVRMTVTRPAGAAAGDYAIFYAEGYVGSALIGGVAKSVIVGADVPPPTVIFPEPKAVIPTTDFAVTGTAVPYALVRLSYAPGGPEMQTIADGSGNWYLGLSLPESTYVLWARQEVSGRLSPPAGGANGIPFTVGLNNPTVLTLAPVTANYGDTVNLQALLTSGGVAVYDRTVNYEVDSAPVGSDNTNYLGQAPLEYEIRQGEGSYLIDAAFAAEPGYLESTATALMTVSPRPVTLSYTGDRVARGQPFALKAQLHTEAGDPAKAEPIQFTIRQGDSVIYTTQVAVDSQGGAEAPPLETLQAGTYTLTLHLPPNAYFTAPDVTVVIRAETELSVTPVSSLYAETVSLKATLTSGGAHLAGQPVLFEVGEATFGPVLTDASGMAVISGFYVDLPAGSYAIRASFAGTGELAPVTAQGQLTVSARPATLAYTGSLNAADSPFLLRAKASSDGGDISRAGPVTFHFTQPVSGQVSDVTADVDSTGTALTYRQPPLYRQNLTVTIAPGYYQAAAQTHEIAGPDPTDLTVEDAEGRYAETMTLRARLVSGGPVVGRSVAFTVAGAPVGTAVTDSTGIASLPHSIGLPAGAHPIEAGFAGDSAYAPASGSATLSVSRLPAVLHYEGDTTATGLPFHARAHLEVTAGDVSLAGQVRFTLDQPDTGRQLSCISVINPDGIAECWIPNTTEGLTGTWAGTAVLISTYYQAAPVLFPVTGTDPTILEAPDISARYADEVILRATLITQGYGVRGKTVRFLHSAAEIGQAITDVNGVASLPYLSDKPAGSHEFTAVFDGTPAFGASSDPFQLSVARRPVQVRYAGETEEINGQPVTLTGEFLTDAGDLAHAGSLQLTVTGNGSTFGPFAAIVDSGTGLALVTPDLTGLEVGTYTVSVSLLPNDYYTAPDAQGAFRIRWGTTLQPESSEATYADAGGVSLTAWLSTTGPDPSGKPIAFALDGADAGADLTDPAGLTTVTVSTDRRPGTYQIHAAYQGDNLYAPSQGSSTLTLKKRPATITNTTPTTFTTPSVTLSAQITSDAGEITRAGPVIFTLTEQGAGNVLESYEAQVDATGNAAVHPGRALLGKFDLTVSLASDSYIAAPVGPIELTGNGTRLTVADLEARYADAVNLEALLVNTGGLPDRLVRFKVNGVDAGTANTDAGGVARRPFSIDLKAGSYQVEAFFDGDATYGNSAVSGTLTVVRRPATLTYTGDMISTGEPFILRATVNSDGGSLPLAGPVTFTLWQGEDEYGQFLAAVNPDGTTDPITLAPLWGGYQVVAAIQSEYYVATPDRDAIKADPATVAFTVSAASGRYADQISLTASMATGPLPVKARTINFYVNDQFVGAAVTDAAGVAALLHNIDVGEGVHLLRGESPGDAYYDQVSVTADLTVVKRPASLAYTGDRYTTGGPFALRARVTSDAGDIQRAGPVTFDSATTGPLDAPLNRQNETEPPLLLPSVTGSFTMTTSINSPYYAADPVTTAIAAGSLVVDDLTGIYREEVHLRAVFLADGAPVAGATVLFRVAGYPVGSAVTDSSGAAWIPYNIGLASGTWPIEAAVARDPESAPLIGAGTLTVDSGASFQCQAENVSGRYADEVLLRMKCTYNTGGVEDRPVTFMVNGKTVGTAATDLAGVALLPYIIDEGKGEYPITALFTGNEIIPDATATAILTVSKRPATLGYTGEKYFTTGPYTLKALVVSDAGEITRAGKVTFKVTQDAFITDVVQSDVTADGTAIASVPLLSGQHTVTLSISSDYYTAVEVSEPVEGYGTGVLIDFRYAQYADTTPLRARFVKGGQGVPNKSITFVVSGVTVGTAITDGFGIAQVPYTVTEPKGYYPVSAIFHGDAEYPAYTANGRLTVWQRPGDLQYTGDTVLADPFTMRASVTSTAGDIILAGPVTFTIVRLDNVPVQSHQAPVESSGTAESTIAPPPLIPPFAVVVSIDSPYYVAGNDSRTITGEALTSMVADPATGQYSETVELKATLTLAGSTPGAGVALTFKVDGVPVGTPVTDASGVAALPYLISLPAGVHTFTAEYAEGGIAVDADLTVLPENAALTYTGGTVSTGGSLELSAQLVQEDDGEPGGLALAGSVRFTVIRNSDSVTVHEADAAVAADGVAAAPAATIPAGVYTVVTTLLPNGYFTAQPDSDLIAGGTVLTSAAAAAHYSDLAALKATLTLADGTPLADQTVAFTVDGEPAGSAVTGSDGTATLEYPVSKPAGIYPVVGTYAGSSTHAPSTSEAAELTVAHEEATVIYTGDQVAAGGPFTLSAQATQAGDGFPGDITLAAVTFTLTHNGDGTVLGPYTAPVQADGSATYPLSSLAPAGHTATTELVSDYFAAPSDSDLIKGQPILTVLPAAGQYSDPVTLSASLFADGAPLAGQSIAFMVDGQPTGQAVTGPDGIATFPYLIGLGQGSYEVAPYFAGSADFTEASGTNTLTASHEAAALTYLGEWMTAGGSTPLKGALTQEADGNPGAITLAGNLSWQLTNLITGADAGTVAGPVQPDGTAQAASPDLVNAPHQVVLSLPTNAYFSAVPVSHVIKGTPALTVTGGPGQYSDPVPLVAELTGGAGGIAGKTITFYVNGTVVGAVVTDAAGKATLPYTIGLPAGAYPVLAEFSGDDHWVAAVPSEQTLTVTPENASLAYEGPWVSQPGSVTLKAKVAQENDGSAGDLTLTGVGFSLHKNINGTDYGPWETTVLADGSAQTTQPLSEGRYDITISLSGNGYFTAADDHDSLVVDGTPPIPPPAPTVTEIACLTTTVSWSASTDNLTGIAKYEVYRSGTLVATLPGSATSWTDTALQPGTTYSYTIRAYDGAGSSAESPLSGPITPTPCASGVKSKPDHKAYHDIETNFTVALTDTYVNIRYTFTDWDGNLAYEFWAFVSAVVQPVGKQSITVPWDGSSTPGEGKWTLETQLWFGNSPDNMYPGLDVDSKKINIKVK